jgi:NTP pyrophosphatase (non-canonical NTP hydrolase)
MLRDESVRLAQMTLDAYIKFVRKQILKRPEAELILGIGGEAGEVQEWFKKVLYHKREDLAHPQLIEELGDVLFHVVALALKEGISIDSLMTENVSKVTARYPDGWKTGGGVR